MCPPAEVHSTSNNFLKKSSGSRTASSSNYHFIRDAEYRFKHHWRNAIKKTPESEELYLTQPDLFNKESFKNGEPLDHH